MANGLIAAFAGGMGKGAADAGRILLMDKLNKERGEAEDLRNRQLRQDLQSDRQGFLTGERDANQKWKSTENRLDRKSAEGAADLKAKAATAKDTSTNQLKNIKGIMANSDKTFLEAAAVVFPGAQIDYTTVDGERMVAVMSEDGYTELGRFTENDVGKGVFVNKGEKPDRTPGVFTSAEVKAEQEALSKENYIFDASRDEAKESLKKKQDAGQGGIVNSAANPSVGINNSVPKTVMPAPEKVTPKKIGASPYPEGTELKGKDGKIYVVTNGKPVLKTPQ